MTARVRRNPAREWLQRLGHSGRGGAPPSPPAGERVKGTRPVLTDTKTSEVLTWMNLGNMTPDGRSQARDDASSDSVDLKCQEETGSDAGSVGARVLEVEGVGSLCEVLIMS